MGNCGGCIQVFFKTKYTFWKPQISLQSISCAKPVKSAMAIGQKSMGHIFPIAVLVSKIPRPAELVDEEWMDS